MCKKTQKSCGRNVDNGGDLDRGNKNQNTKAFVQ